MALLKSIETPQTTPKLEFQSSEKKFLPRYARTLEDVLQILRELNEKGMQGAVSVLPRGHFFNGRPEDEQKKYAEVLSATKSAGLHPAMTVKLSQLDPSHDYCRSVAGVRELAARCREYDSFLWIDMEQSRHVDLALQTYDTLAGEFSNLGICVQSCLRRTERDLLWLLKNRAPVRLVKGFYREWPPAAYATWEEVTENFKRLLAPLLERSRFPAVATHDILMLREARRIQAKTGCEAEYQFFLAVKSDLARNLVYEGANVRIYIPYGSLLPYMLHSLPVMDLLRNFQRRMGVERIR